MALHMSIDYGWGVGCNLRLNWLVTNDLTSKRSKPIFPSPVNRLA